MNIWMYWDGSPMPEIVQFCIDTVRHHNIGRIRVVRQHEMVEMAKTCALDIDMMKAMKPQHQSDFVRAFVLAHHGGFWIDTDFLCFAPVDSVLKGIEPRHTFAYYRHQDVDGLDSVMADFTWAANPSLIAQGYLHEVVQFLKREGGVVNWNSIGARVLTPLINGWAGDTRHVQTPFEIPVDLVSPFRRMCLNLDADLPNEAPVPKDSVGMMVINSLSDDYLKEKPLAEWMKSATVIGSFLRQARARMYEPPVVTYMGTVPR